MFDSYMKQLAKEGLMKLDKDISSILDEISTAEAAQILKCSERTVRNMIERGSLHARKLDPTSKSIYILKRSEVVAFRSGGSKKKTRRR